MKSAKLSNTIHYIGVNDRTTHKFEGMWPLPAGVSYNSYLVTGSEKAAIIDGVEVSHALQQIDSIQEILGDRKPDYLILNHLEPDHSGSIRILRQTFPDITIVGNAQTLAMVKGFYGLDANTLTIKDGESLSLGENTTLTFALTPKVHWPETMVTYYAEEKTLFSGDAFGCFGALNGAVVDRQMNTGRYFPEMIRYYSNIVGKYGMFVQRALKKLECLQIERICSTHGPVWEEKIPEVIDIYDRLSRYEPLDNGVTIVYGSMYGNTERMAEAAAEALAEAGIRDISVLNASVTDLSYIIAEIFTHRGLIIAAPTYSDTLFPPVNAVMEAIVTRGLKNRCISIMGSCTWSERATKVLNGHTESLGLSLTGETVTVKHAPKATDLEKIKAEASALAKVLLGE